MKKTKQKFRRTLTIESSFAETEKQEREYWLKQTPQARLRAMEMMRRINYRADGESD